MSLHENRSSPTSRTLPTLSSRPSLSAVQPGTQTGPEHFSAQSRLWGALHERLGRAGVAQLLREGPRDALELQILHVAGFVENTGVDATAYLPWNAPISWQDRTQPFYRALLGSLPEEEAPSLGLDTVGTDSGGVDLGAVDLGFSGMDAGFSGDLGLGLSGGVDVGGEEGWSGSAGDAGFDAGGGATLSLSRDALGEGPDPSAVFSTWFGTRLQAAGGGRALTPAEQDFLREVHGRSFNDVRVHEGPGARQASRAIAARAFTMGNDIFIGDSGDLLSSAAGAELLAHEVTHVVQNDAGRLPSAPREGLSVSTPNQPHEQEAAAIGRRARAVFQTFEEKSVQPVGREAWGLDPSWDGDPIGQAVAAHLQSVLPEARQAELGQVLEDLREGARSQARSSVAGQHVLVDVAEALGEDAEIVAGLRGALGGLQEQASAGGLGELVELGATPDLGVVGFGTPGFSEVAGDLLAGPGDGFAPLSGGGLGGQLFAGGALSSETGGSDAGGSDAGAVARKASAGAGEDGDATGVVDRAMRSRGQGTSLPQDLRGRLEARLGVSLAGVRLHTDLRAAQAAEAVNAEAFTVGQDIYFNTGAFDPSSPAGIELIAHETTHAAQFLQGREGEASTTEGGVGVTKPGDAVEMEAEAVGAEIASDVDSGAAMESAGEAEQSVSAGTSVEGGQSAELGGATGASQDGGSLDSGSGAETSASASGGAEGGDTVARSLLDSAGSMLGGLGAPLSQVAAGGSNSPLGIIRTLGPKIAAGVPGLQQAMPLIEAVMENKGIPGLDKLDDNVASMLGKAVPGLEAAMPLIQSVVDNKGLPSLKDLGGPALTALGMAIPGVGAALPLVQGLVSGEGITAKNLTGAVMGALGTAIPGLGLAMPLVQSLLDNKSSGVGGLLSGASGLLGGAGDMLTGAGGLLTGAGSLLGRASGVMSGAEGVLGALSSVIPGGSLLTGLMQNKDVLGAAAGGASALFGTLGSAIPGLSGMLGGGLGGLLGGAGTMLGGMFGGQGGQDGGGLSALLGAGASALGGIGGVAGGAAGLLGGLMGGDNKGGGMDLGGLLGGALGGVAGPMGSMLGGGIGSMLGAGASAITSSMGEIGSAGSLAQQAMQIPGLTDLVNVVETGLSNVAGEGKGLGRGSLAEGADTVGWIMQAVPGLPQLVSVLRGGLADQMGNGSGQQSETLTSGTAGEEQVGSADRILGLDLNQAVGAGLSQVGGPTAGAAAQAGSPQGRGAVDVLDTALPGLSEFVDTVKSGATQLGGPVGMATNFLSNDSGNNRSGGLGGVAGKVGGMAGQGAQMLGGMANKAKGLFGGLF